MAPWTNAELERLVSVKNYAKKHFKHNFWGTFVSPRFPGRTETSLQYRLVELKRQPVGSSRARQMMADKTWDEASINVGAGSEGVGPVGATEWVEDEIDELDEDSGAGGGTMQTGPRPSQPDTANQLLDQIVGRVLLDGTQPWPLNSQLQLAHTVNYLVASLRVNVTDLDWKREVAPHFGHVPHTALRAQYKLIKRAIPQTEATMLLISKRFDVAKLPFRPALRPLPAPPVFPGGKAAGGAGGSGGVARKATELRVPVPPVASHPSTRAAYPVEVAQSFVSRPSAPVVSGSSVITQTVAGPSHEGIPSRSAEGTPPASLSTCTPPLSRRNTSIDLLVGYPANTFLPQPTVRVRRRSDSTRVRLRPCYHRAWPAVLGQSDPASLSSADHRGRVQEVHPAREPTRACGAGGRGAE